MTDSELLAVTLRINSLVIAADSEEELYRKLNVLSTHGSPNWQLLRCPWWVGKTLIAVVVKPDKESQ